MKFDSGKFSYSNSRTTDTIYSKIDTVYINKETTIPARVAEIQYKMTRAQTFFYSVGVIALCLAGVWIVIKINFKQLWNIILKLFKL